MKLKKLAVVLLILAALSVHAPTTAHALTGVWVYEGCTVGTGYERTDNIGSHLGGYYLLEFTQNSAHYIDDLGLSSAKIYTYEAEAAWEQPPQYIPLGDESSVSLNLTATTLSGEGEGYYGSLSVSVAQCVMLWLPANDKYEAGYNYMQYNEDLGWANTSPGSNESKAVPLFASDPDALARSAELFGIELKAQLWLDVSVNNYQACHYVYTLEADPGETVVVESAASETEGEDEDASIDIPGGVAAAVVGGSTVAVITAVAKSRKKKKGAKSTKKQPARDRPRKEPEEDEEDKPNSKFRMVLYKEFGNTLIVGDEPKSVYARIEELPPGGAVVQRPDLTARIRIFSVKNITVLNTAMAGQYMTATIEADGDAAKADSGTVAFSFSSGGDRIQNNVTFCIEGKPEIIFADEGITFLACSKQSFSMPFIVKGMGGEPELTVSVEKGGEAFTAKLSPGENGTWNAELTECGTKTDIGGSMEEYTCTVTAKSGERSIDGCFYAYRYHEGLRMALGCLKCYPVVMTEPERDELTEDRKIRQTPAHSRVELTLYTWDEESGELRNPIPDKCPVFTFEDVPDSGILYDSEGSGVDKPCDRLKFTYALKEIIGNNNTLLGFIYPTAGVLVPPNRCRATVSVKVSWNGRDFTAKQEVTLSSQPYRYGMSNEEFVAQLKTEEKYTANLLRIRQKILFEEKYSELLPMLHKIDLMVEAYDADYGYYMPDYYKLLSLFERYGTGEIGSVEANADALSWKSIMADGLHMTLTSINESGAGIAARMTIGVLTGGASEIVFLPAQALYDMRNYVDQGGDSALMGFVVGLKTVAMDQLSGAAMGKAMKLGGKAMSSGAKALRRGASSAKKLITEKGQQLVKSYNAAKYAKKLTAAAKKTSDQLKAAKSACEKKIIRSRKLIETSEEALLLDEAYVAGRKEGLRKVDELRAAIKRSRVDPNYSKHELREAVLAVQQDKHALNQLKDSTKFADDGLRGRFNHEIDAINDEAIYGTRKQLAQKYKVPLEDIECATATGNATDLRYSGKSISMDKDVTFRIKDGDRFIDLSEEIAGEAYNDSFFKVAHAGAPAADSKVAAKFAQMCDQAVVSGTGKESYQTWENLQRVINSSRAGEKFDELDKLVGAVKYKSAHFMEQAELGYKVAEEALKNGDRELARYALSGAEALTEEGIRQSTKQFNRITVPRLEVLAIKGKQSNMTVLMEKMQLLQKCGLGARGSTGITVAELRTILKAEYNTTIEAVIEEAGEAVRKLDGLL